MKKISLFRFRYVPSTGQISITYINTNKSHRRTRRIRTNDGGNTIVEDVDGWFRRARGVNVLGYTESEDYYYLVTEFIPFDKF